MFMARPRLGFVGRWNSGWVSFHSSTRKEQVTTRSDAITPSIPPQWQLARDEWPLTQRVFLDGTEHEIINFSSVSP
jgi:hypothetical protein